ncbi:MAG TPA: glucose-6-phosphate dehydrogenase [Thermoplasmata archaeon]|nr:glucose-6-phosphate dehydrogenase [Thermoplasmata archaeon]
MAQPRPIDPHLFVVLGATGDLMHRKLLPSLFRVCGDEQLGGKLVLLGAARAPLTDDAFRATVVSSLGAAGASPSPPPPAWAGSQVHYQRLDPTGGQGYDALAARIRSLEAEHGLTGNRVFYLALPVDAVGPAVAGLGRAGLAKGPGWTRLVVEKPFGHDLASAEALNQGIHQWFDESQVYRIDHYLGKETVQNLLVFRFANTLFESLWSRDRVDCVEVTVAENLGVEERAGYYESAGALRDMVQNHLTQLVTLTAMEVPAVLEADAVRNEKVKVLQAVAPIRPEDAIFGQYVAGTVDGAPVRGYREEDGVSPQSTTETYVALRLKISNWRWQGVPFLLRTGKRLGSKSTRIVVSFRRPPVSFFPTNDPQEMRPNTLTITVQPDEGFELSFELKPPGHALQMQTHRMHFAYAEVFGPLADAYQTLLTDLMEGDQTLFVRADEVEAAWQLFTPLLEHRPALAVYPAGSAGPSEADALAKAAGYTWSTDA